MGWTDPHTHCRFKADLSRIRGPGSPTQILAEEGGNPLIHRQMGCGRLRAYTPSWRMGMIPGFIAHEPAFLASSWLPMKPPVGSPGRFHWPHQPRPALALIFA